MAAKDFPAALFRETRVLAAPDLGPPDLAVPVLEAPVRARFARDLAAPDLEATDLERLAGPLARAPAVEAEAFLSFPAFLLEGIRGLLLCCPAVETGLSAA